MRLDQFLLLNNLCKSRTHGSDLIREGRVRIRGEIVKKTSFDCEGLTVGDVAISAGEFPEFVSRGGIKLWGALELTKISVVDQIVLDVGQSTGGFTDCLLRRRARSVVGIDVGSDQIDETLRKDPRVQVLEKVNIKDLSPEMLAHKAFKLVVCDLSFISLSQALPAIKKFLDPQGDFLGLVKPQFEVGAENLNKSGIVKDPKLFKEVEKKISSLCQHEGLRVKQYFKSVIDGKDGNTEFFVWCQLNE